MSGTLHALYVEDSTADADLTRTHFDIHDPDIQLDVVATGHACLARVRERPYDVLLVDNHLPDMDGVDLLKQVTGQHLPLPVVMVTAVGDETLAVQALRLGAWDYVPKHGNYIERLPLVLRHAVTEFRRLNTLDQSIGGTQRRILYAEHSAADIDLTVSHCAEVAAHLNFEIAPSLQEALARIQDGGVDLLLTDLRMPDGSALDLLREARHRDLHVPIVVITGQGDEAAAVAAVKLGAYDYIVKRADYLTQLPYALENAIHRAQLVELNRRLHAELAERRRAEAHRAELEARLRQAQRMESIGRLAGGVAHDFNNFLTAINGYADLIRQGLPPDHPAAADLGRIRTAGERAAGLTRQLLAFSRKQLLQPRVLALNALIAETSTLLERLVGDDVELVTALDPALGNVRADAGQIEQVIMNLAVNARDAMTRGGTLTVETRNAVVDARDPRRPMPPGAYVVVAVSDTGSGIDADTLPHIFEPFFTTKELGKGTGLGLSTTYGIVKQSGGWIWVDSDPGQGTRFEIHLPRVDEPVTHVEGSRPEPTSPRGSETVLLVEDDEIVSRLVSHVLRKSGYQVLEAGDASEAIRLSAEHQGPIPLMITDVVMPRMGGRELATLLHQSRPAMRVLYMSGYTDDSVVRQGLLDPVTAFIQKPFTTQALERRVRDLLDESW